jgi:hypothetical protein
MVCPRVVVRLFIPVVCALIAACATEPVFVIDPGAQQADVKSSVGITLIDKRPADDRESSIGSLMITSDRYGIQVLGDERFVPAPTVALANRAERMLSGMLLKRPSSVTITLNRFNTQNNMQTAMRQGAIGASGLGPLGVAIAEGMFGKLREQNIDARKPFVLTYAEVAVEFLWPDNTRVARNITVLKANNYSESDLEEQKAVVAKTVSSALDTLAADFRELVQFLQKRS